MAVFLRAALHLFVVTTAIAATVENATPSRPNAKKHTSVSSSIKYAGEIDDKPDKASAPAAFEMELAATARQDEAPSLASAPSNHGSRQAAVHSEATPAGIPGFDVSHWQPANIAWSTHYRNGARFVYMKATEGTTYKDPNFNTYYPAAYNAGFIRGAYHFAQPSTSSGSGAAQATYFFKNGGGWSKDGKTLPGMLDIEYGPAGKTCYGLTQSQMVTWITDFHATYKKLSTRYPVIYTTTDWWKTCTGNTNKFGSTSPLFIARYSTTVGTLPAGWSTYTFWQYADSGQWPGDQDVFNGSIDRLKVLACIGQCSGPCTGPC